jgi:hypothetical protein
MAPIWPVAEGIAKVSRVAAIARVTRTIVNYRVVGEEHADAMTYAD